MTEKEKYDLCVNCSGPEEYMRVLEADRVSKMSRLQFLQEEHAIYFAEQLNLQLTMIKSVLDAMLAECLTKPDFKQAPTP